MSCKYYNNNGCSCAGCTHFVKSIEITYEKNFINIVIPEMIFNNHDRICLCLAQSIPAGIDADTTVVVQVGTGKLATMPVLTRLGNFLYADAIKSRKVYPLIAATDGPVFVLSDLCKLGKTQHVFPTVPTSFPSRDPSKSNKKEG